MSNEKIFDVCVVGLGAMGSQITLALQRRGFRVIGFDRFRPPHAFGSSHGSTRMIREAYFEDPLYVPIVQRAYELWRQLERDSGKSLLVETGGVVVGPRTGQLVSGAIASAEAHNLEHEVLDARAARTRFPMFAFHDNCVVHEPRAGFIFPEQGIDVCLSLAKSAGAALRFDDKVELWRSRGSAVEIEAHSGTYAAEQLVLAAGAWMPTLSPDLALTVARQPLLWFTPLGRPELFDTAVMPVFLWEIDADRVFYGFPRDTWGVKVARHHHGSATEADHLDRALAADDVQVVRSFLEKAMPLANGPLANNAVCMYTNTRDHNFLIDRHPDAERVWIVSACSGHGYKFAPAIGEIVATLCAGEEPQFNLAPFATRS